jgi:methionyl-tRNA formyltransferase
MNSKDTINVLLIGCVASSEVALRSLLGLKQVTLVGIVTRRASKFNSDFVNLAPIAEANNIPLLLVEETSDSSHQEDWIRARRPDLIFVIGWSKLLPEEVLRICPNKVVGFHPSALPKNRGRHPIVWALALGLTETATSFFLMDSGTDSGPIVSQYPVSISPSDTAESLYQKILALIPKQIAEITYGFLENTLMPLEQDKARATYWRKRSEHDGQIDWRMSAGNIYNLVRALSKPYPGAHFMHQGHVVKVWSCTVEPSAPLNAEPGKVLLVKNREVVIKAGEHAIRIIDHDMTTLPSEGDYI